MFFLQIVIGTRIISLCVCYRYEDLRALDGGADGLSVILPILKWASTILKPGGHLYLETDPCHPYVIPKKLEQLKKENSQFDISIEKVFKDFADKERFIVFRKDAKI